MRGNEFPVVGESKARTRAPGLRMELDLDDEYLNIFSSMRAHAVGTRFGGCRRKAQAVVAAASSFVLWWE